MALQTKRKANPEGRMALREHLRELRNRLIKAMIALLLGCIAGFFLYQPVFRVLSEPIAELQERGRVATLNFDGVASSFDLMFQTSLFIGLILASPVILYQVWGFVTPGLKKNERKYALSFIAVAVPLFLAGIATAYIILPSAVYVLTGFVPDGVPTSNIITAQMYLMFVMRLMIAFGIAFVLPVILFGLNLIGILKGKTILKSWRITVFIICLFSAIATPGGDALTMFAMAGPLLLLFGLAIGLSIWNDKRREKKNAKLVAAAEAEIKATPVKDL
ncbi:twin-arginine translocase subunit TatC [Haematomicrobium sanguinis]|uniref:twin-arginine translocase subunit TatC n=1 Tax=Haematomicrobium sanguinis TaxID=479106 RepID=UPI00047E302A|nr:twin-arginine translocase subunit TatC [Haematomicrobium sanguinis]